MFKSHKVKSNHRDLTTNKVDTYEAPVLNLIIAPLFYQPKRVLTPASMLCLLDYISIYLLLECCVQV
jgi:hypothetical protein